MVLVDLSSKGIAGRDAEKMLESTCIIVNRNVIPNDPLSPDLTSGIRIGASAISARGMESDEARHIVGLIDAVVSSCGQRETLDHVASEVAFICRDHPVYL
jgi:glycine hydroxymethyltransferase